MQKHSHNPVGQCCGDDYAVTLEKYKIIMTSAPNRSITLEKLELTRVTKRPIWFFICSPLIYAFKNNFTTYISVLSLVDNSFVSVLWSDGEK